MAFSMTCRSYNKLRQLLWLLLVVILIDMQIVIPIKKQYNAASYQPPQRFELPNRPIIPTNALDLLGPYACKKHHFTGRCSAELVAVSVNNRAIRYKPMSRLTCKSYHSSRSRSLLLFF